MTDKKTQSAKYMSEILSGAGITMLGSFAGMFFSYIFRGIIGRVYQREGYGMISIAIAASSILATISLLGLNAGISRFIPNLLARNEKGKLRAAMFMALKMVIALSLLLACIFYIFAPFAAEHIFHDTSLTWILRAFCLVLPFNVLLQFGLGVFRGMKRMAYIAVCNNFVVYFGRIATLLFLVVIGASVQSLFIAYLIGSALAVAAIVILFLKDPLYKEIKHIKSVPVHGELLRFSLPLTFSNIVKRFDVLIVGFFMKSSCVGLYNAALPLAMLQNFFPFSIYRILMPVASGLHGSGEKEQINILYKKSARIAMALTLPVFAYLFIFPTPALTLVFGSDFEEASTSLRILAVGFFVSSSTGSFGEMFQVYSKTNTIFIMSGIRALCNITFMSFLMPRFGLIGAAWAMSTSLLIVVLTGMLILYKYTKLYPFSKKYLITLLLAIALYMPLCIASNIYKIDSFALSAALFVPISTIYIIMLFVTGCLKFSEIKELRKRKI